MRQQTKDEYSVQVFNAAVSLCKKTRSNESSHPSIEAATRWYGGPGPACNCQRRHRQRELVTGTKAVGGIARLGIGYGHRFTNTNI